jgi:hypothetical protein
MSVNQPFYRGKPYVHREWITFACIHNKKNHFKKLNLDEINRKTLMKIERKHTTQKNTQFFINEEESYVV